jgi:uncharacterized protein YeaO (DUF488 family)
MERGAPSSRLPAGIRQDTRKHTRHVLRPDAELVRGALSGEVSFEVFATRYRELVRARFAADRAPFDRLAELARGSDVYLGCSCPTAKNPDVRRCHTFVALELMKELYPDLDVRFPA